MTMMQSSRTHRAPGWWRLSPSPNGLSRMMSGCTSKAQWVMKSLKRLISRTLMRLDVIR